MDGKRCYHPPRISISEVVLENGIAVGVSVYLEDWVVEPTPVGETPDVDGGYIILF